MYNIKADAHRMQQLQEYFEWERFFEIVDARKKMQLEEREKSKLAAAHQNYPLLVLLKLITSWKTISFNVFVGRSSIST